MIRSCECLHEQHATYPHAAGECRPRIVPDDFVNMRRRYVCNACLVEGHDEAPQQWRWDRAA